MSAALVLLPTLLAILAEAAWVSVVAALLQAFTLHPPAVGFAWFLAAAVLGLLAARVLPPRLGDRWPVAAAGLALAAGAMAWLSSAEVRAILVAQGTDGLGEAIAANLGAWLVAVAFVRGIAHARLPEDPHPNREPAGPRDPRPCGRRRDRRDGRASPTGAPSSPRRRPRCCCSS